MASVSLTAFISQLPAQKKGHHKSGRLYQSLLNCLPKDYIIPRPTEIKKSSFKGKVNNS
jgi:hypothetical protein